MKRLHVHVSVDDLARSIGFYSALFAARPTVVKPDYAKWMLEDPRVNFAISARDRPGGLDHLGIQVETGEELREVYARLRQAEQPVLEEGATTCCYARSEKAWIADPQGLAWETFLTTGESTVYGDGLGADAARTTGDEGGACCAPKAAKTKPAAATACCGPAREAAAS